MIYLLPFRPLLQVSETWEKGKLSELGDERKIMSSFLTFIAFPGSSGPSQSNTAGAFDVCSPFSTSTSSFAESRLLFSRSDISLSSVIDPVPRLCCDAAMVTICNFWSRGLVLNPREAQCFDNEYREVRSEVRKYNIQEQILNYKASVPQASIVDRKTSFELGRSWVRSSVFVCE
jgi:hypothetical protein